MHLSKVGRFELLHVSLVCDEFCLSLSRICHENVCHNSRLTSLKEQWRQWKPQPSDYWDDMGWLSVTIDYVDVWRKELRLRDLTDEKQMEKMKGFSCLAPCAPCAQLPSSLGPGRTMSLAPAMQISSIHQALRRCGVAGASLERFGFGFCISLHIFAYRNLNRPSLQRPSVRWLSWWQGIFVAWKLRSQHSTSHNVCRVWIEMKKRSEISQKTFVDSLTRWLLMSQRSQHVWTRELDFEISKWMSIFVALECHFLVEDFFIEFSFSIFFWKTSRFFLEKPQNIFSETRTAPCFCTPGSGKPTKCTAEGNSTAPTASIGGSSCALGTKTSNTVVVKSFSMSKMYESTNY